MKTLATITAVIAATIAYLAGMNALGAPAPLTNLLLLALYAAGLGYAVYRWP